jgi:RNA polymerase sigma-70 factor (ECF subfamily)
MTDLRDPVQFDRAYKEHRGAMLIAAQRVLRDKAAAEDVVQDVFMNLWRNPKAFDSTRASLSTYLTLLARSRAVDRWRSRTARDAAVERSADQARALRPPTESAEEPVLRREGSRHLLKAVDTLPEDQREAVLLAFGGGLSAREISTAAKVPLGTAKSRVRLGLQKTRAVLEAA